MNMLRLDPEAIAQQARRAVEATRIPSCARSVVVGSLGFCVASLLVFGLWASSGRWLQAQFGELGFYLICAGLYIHIAAWGLHRLVIGQETFSRFYLIFGLAFGAYAVGWCLCWFGLRGRLGEWAGSLAGSALLGLVLSRAFGAPKAAMRVIAVLFVLHSLGYFLGGWIYAAVNRGALAGWLNEGDGPVSQATVAKLLWGAGYGLGFGAGLGYAIYACQAPVRSLLANDRH